MNGMIKIKSKTLLLGCNGRLFFSSLLSIVLRWGTVAAATVGVFLLFYYGYVERFLSLWNKYAMYAFLVAVMTFGRFVISLFISGIRLGEQFIYFRRAEGLSAGTSKMFSFLSPKKSSRAFSLYLRINYYKSLWLLMFLSPPLLCGAIIWYLYVSSQIITISFYALCIGAAALLSVSLFYYRCVVLRYSAAPYYLCLEEHLKPSDAIKKSIKFTDGFLKDGVFLRASLTGWALTGFLMLPLLYVLPFCRLTLACWTVNAVSLKVPIAQKYDYPIVLTPLKEKSAEN